jgi:hypothetical protein
MREASCFHQDRQTEADAGADLHGCYLNRRSRAVQSFETLLQHVEPVPGAKRLAGEAGTVVADLDYQ